MLTLDQLIQVLTEDQVLERFLTNLETLGIPARSWRKGGVSRVILRSVAKMYAGFTLVMSAFIKSGFLDTAEGGWLTLLAYYVYGVTRTPATFANGSETLTNTGGGIYSYGIGEVSLRNPTTKKVYTNAEAFTLNPGDSFPVAILAVELGTASNAPPGTITELVTTMLNVVVTNPAAIVGTDEQNDDDLRQMCRDKLATLSGLGPRGAYAFAVRAAKRDDGTSVDVNRMSISPSSSTGKVIIYVASSSGAPSPADLDFIRASIERIARPDTATVTVLAATPVALAKTITVWATTTIGISAADIEGFVSAALISMVSSYPIGGRSKPPSTQGYLFTSAIEGAAEAAHPSIFAVDGVGGDIAINLGQVATLATTINVRLSAAA